MNTLRSRVSGSRTSGDLHLHSDSLTWKWMVPLSVKESSLPSVPLAIRFHVPCSSCRVDLEDLFSSLSFRC